LKEVIVSVYRKVLMEVDNNSFIVGNPQGILEKQVRPRPIHLLNNMKLNNFAKYAKKKKKTENHAIKRLNGAPNFRHFNEMLPQN
jgi:hypothetical protein